MTRSLLLTALLLVACREGLDREREPRLRELCAAYCPQRVACVEDNFVAGEVERCVDRCSATSRFLEQNACGEASFAALECLAGLECEALPAAVRAVISSDPEVGCRAELLAQQDDCDFRPRY